jgi:formate hydrogenlyase subunit 3/multisubunit Na+/H+ antiporter MnhD subunit
MMLFVAGLALIAAAGGAATLARRSRLGNPAYVSLLLAGCAVAAVDPVRVLVSGSAQTLVVPSSLPGGAWVVAIDALSATFLLTILAVGAMCAVFGTHLLATSHTRRPVWFAQLCFAALLASIALVVAAGGVLLFMMAWEVMAISSYLLIVTDHEEAEVRRAGLIYLVATHTATLALFALFALLTNGSPDWSFATLAHLSSSLSSATVTGALLLALVGFGFKAGIVPFHFWLPPAHASAPSHVSALMSGVVIKTGIYGILRVVLILGGAPAWWGWLILVLGISSGILGVLWALVQHDMKRLLAYHSVENIGIILMGIGVGVLGNAHANPAVAMLGYAGALLHTVNHALFKSLLFLGAGSAYAATGTREMDRLGGLARQMPVTWLAFAIGAAAIIGVPPLNGFVSEWLVYQSLYTAGQSHEMLRLAVLGMPALALIGALALACFAKVSGIAFLGNARSPEAASASERSAGMLTPMVALSAACIVLGVAPMLGIAFVSGAAGDMAGVPAASMPADVVSGARGIAVVAAIILGLGMALWALRRRLLRDRAVRSAPTWNCGYATPAPRAQYTASSFASPLVAVFGQLGGVTVHRTAGAYRTTAIDLVLDAAVRPLWRAAQHAALRLRPMQQGRLHWYLLYVMGALLALLGYLAFGLRR